MTSKELQVDETIYKSFWDEFSVRPNMDSMMLNTSSDELEALDRQDIISSLPNYTGMDIADIGAGIGRFTSTFAERARHVIATDFIESFIETNQKRNARFNNISYCISDTSKLNLKSERLAFILFCADRLALNCFSSLDLVFTNWLLMYMNDIESIKFLFDVLNWLRPDGYLHLRESCAEPSTGRSKSVSMHKTNNPTRYRFSSIYIQLLNTIRYVDKNDNEWRFNVEWAKSVPTYIEKQSNWRQVHWVARKTLVKNFLALEFSERFSLTLNLKNDQSNLINALNKLENSIQKNKIFFEKLIKMSEEWLFEQWIWDLKLDGERTAWTDNIFKNILSNKMIEKSSTIFVYNPRRIGYHSYINANALSERFACNVWSVEINPFMYRVSLTKANKLKDHRVQFSWHYNIKSAIDFWKDSENNILSHFNGFIAVDLFKDIQKVADFENIASIMKVESFFVLLEYVKDNDDEAVERFIQKIKMIEKIFKLISVIDVTEIVESSMQNYFQSKKNENEIKPNGLRWLIIQAQL